MNNLFNDAIFKFPNSKELILKYVQFNIEKKYNLNTAKIFLVKLDKLKNSIIEDYKIFILKQKLQTINSRNSDDLSKFFTHESANSKFKKFKTLIETSTKLYKEFWSLLCGSVTSNINVMKLFEIGTQLNLILKEIEVLWEELKFKKVDIDSQSVILLYIYFVKEILKNKNKSDEIFKKYYEELQLKNEVSDSDTFDMEKIDSLLESPNGMIFGRANEQGECKIIQCSNTLVSLLGYLKSDLIGNNIETMMPNMFTQDHHFIIEQKIKSVRLSMALQKDIYKNLEKRKIFTLAKNKAGFLFPVMSSFTLYNDDDFSNNFIIKAEFEAKDSKSIYSYFILTNIDQTIEYISSSCISIGLSMEMVKKYGIKIFYLIRNFDCSPIDFINKDDDDYEINNVKWINPELLYPKSNNAKEGKKLVHQVNSFMNMSDEKFTQYLKNLVEQNNIILPEYSLNVKKMRLKDPTVLGYCFRITPIDSNTKQYSFGGNLKIDNKNLFLYNLDSLKFLRVRIDESKIHKHEVLKNNEKFIKKEEIMKKSIFKRELRVKKDFEIIEDNNYLTKEKLISYQVLSSNELKEIIFGLKDFSDGISNFRRIHKNLPSEETFFRVKPVIIGGIEEFKERVKRKVQYKENNEKKESLNYEFESLNYKTILSNYFGDKTIKSLRVSSFAIFISIFIIVAIEFGITIQTFQDTQIRIGFISSAYSILNNILMSKYYITEILFANSYENTYLEGKNSEEYINLNINQLINNTISLTDSYNIFLNSTNSFTPQFTDHYFNRMISIFSLQNQQIIFSKNASNLKQAINQLIPTLNQIANNKLSLNINNTNVFFVMRNNLNDIFISWKDACFILVDDLNQLNDTYKLQIIYGISFLISIISLILVKRFLENIITERERPIDLFLTLRRNKFNELKLACETFLNKLLNKYYGNEDTEEEMLNNESSSTIITPEDINILKFKQAKEIYKNSFKNKSYYFWPLVSISIFFIIFESYMTFKFIFMKSEYDIIYKISQVQNYTHYAQSDLILTLNLERQIFYDNFTILNMRDKAPIIDIILNNSYVNFENMKISTYTSSSYLGDNYTSLFLSVINNDLCNYGQKIIDLFNQSCDLVLIGSMKQGFDIVVSRYLELIRFSLLSHNKFFDSNISSFYKYMNFKELNAILKYLIIPVMNDLNSNSSQNFLNKLQKYQLVFVTIFICFLVFLIMGFFVFWRNFEDDLFETLRKSMELINLMPENFKFCILKCLNEEEQEIKNPEEEEAEEKEKEKKTKN